MFPALGGPLKAEEEDVPRVAAQRGPLTDGCQHSAHQSSSMSDGICALRFCTDPSLTHHKWLRARRLRDPLEYKVGCGCLVEGDGSEGGLRRNGLPGPRWTTNKCQLEISQYALAPQEVTICLMHRWRVFNSHFARRTEFVQICAMHVVLKIILWLNINLT